MDEQEVLDTDAEIFAAASAEPIDFGNDDDEPIDPDLAAEQLEELNADPMANPGRRRRLVAISGACLALLAIGVLVGANLFARQSSNAGKAIDDSLNAQPVAVVLDETRIDVEVTKCEMSDTAIEVSGTATALDEAVRGEVGLDLFASIENFGLARFDDQTTSSVPAQSGEPLELLTKAYVVVVDDQPSSFNAQIALKEEFTGDLSCGLLSAVVSRSGVEDQLAPQLGN